MYRPLHTIQIRRPFEKPKKKEFFRRDLNVKMVGSAGRDAGNVFQTAGGDEPKEHSSRRVRVRRVTM